jgi:tRNA dimethylallyltransferase
MIKDGLINEAKHLINYRHYNALNTVGYKELFDFFDGNSNLETAIEKIKQNTRRLAKRQITWFKRDKSINWFTIDEYKAIVKTILQ